MEASNSYLVAAQAYADGVRVLFAPAGAPTGERGGAGPVSHVDLAAQAEKLSAASAALTAEAEVRLTKDKDPRAQARTSTQLLAKAMTDLEVSAYLLKAAEDEKANISWAEGEA